MAFYRTNTYLAGDWDGDSDLIQTIIKWNESTHWGLSFNDAHRLTQARDTSLPCSIKRSLAERLNASKIFVLVVGDGTKKVTKGGCRYCSSYNSWTGSCTKPYQSADHRSYIQYECEKAARDDLRIVVIYNDVTVDKDKCPDILQWRGLHIPAIYYDRYRQKYVWDYSAIRDAIEG